MKSNKKNRKIIIFLMIIGILTTIGVAFSLEIHIQNYEGKSFIVDYDSTWKVVDNNNKLVLKHKVSDSVLSIQSKRLERNYIDISLKDIISDVIYSIEEQNKDYVLISMRSNTSDKYEAYSYLYENKTDQVLVRIFKKDAMLIIAYYEANSDYYDIVLDSVDAIFDSMEIISGEKVN
jgi:hypothetical protein